MAEEAEGPDSGAEAAASGVDPAAVALALNAANADPSIAEDARAYLRDQRAVLRNQNALIDIQKHHLTEQFKKLRLDIWQQRMGVLLRIATGIVGLAVATGIAFLIWEASESSGLLIEPFSVPPDLAQRGITGEVLAAKLLDHLSQMQAQTNTTRAAQTYVNDWGRQGIKLDIPETGVSLTELDDFLRQKLGHDTYITGEIIRTSSGISLTARAGEDGAESVTGSEADLDGLVQQLSESVYRATQPYRDGMYLASHDRYAEAIPIMKTLAENGPKLDRAYGYGIWGDLSGERDDIDTEVRLLQRAMAAEPNNEVAQQLLPIAYDIESLPEQSLRESKKAVTLLSRNTLEMFSAGIVHLYEQLNQGNVDRQLGDFYDSAQRRIEVVQAGISTSPRTSAMLAGVEAGEHDLAAARATLLDTANYQADYQAGYTALYSIVAKMLIDSEEQNWEGVLTDANATAPMVQKYPGLRSFLPTMTVPLTAYAEAKLGKNADAEAHVAATPADCYDCLIARARIADLGGQHGRADYWFARAIDGQKSIPFAYSYWGQALLERGDPDAAIAKFSIANQKGPKFADPLEMWGETLMAKKQPDQALAKFTEAEKYAPNWGRLHIKWGEALGYVGKKDEAQKQYALAAGLDLSSADKSELAKVRG